MIIVCAPSKLLAWLNVKQLYYYKAFIEFTSYYNIVSNITTYSL